MRTTFGTNISSSIVVLGTPYGERLRMSSCRGRLALVRGQDARDTQRNGSRNQLPFYEIFKFVLFTICLLVLSQESAFSQTKTSPDVLQEISTAIAKVAGQTSPAVVGIWVDINPGSEETSMNQSLDESLRDQQKISFPWRLKTLLRAIRNRKLPRKARCLNWGAMSRRSAPDSLFLPTVI